jgi:hypothetical protein
MTEVLELSVFIDLADAQVSIAQYFDYYDHERLHSSIDDPPITLINSFFSLML